MLLLWENNPIKTTNNKQQIMKINKMLALGGAGLLTLSVAQAATITWTGQGLITDNTFLTLAGTTANEVYGFDVVGALTTANGYSFNNANFNIGLPHDPVYNGYLNGQTSGDTSLNTILANGIYGSQANNPGTLLNLTIGQSYTVMAFIDDNRAGAAGGTLFKVNGAPGNTSAAQLYGTFTSGTPGSPLGGYIMGTFTADATTQAFSVQNDQQGVGGGDFSTGNAQYNGILLEVTAVPEPGVCALLGGGLMTLLALRRKK